MKAWCSLLVGFLFCLSSTTLSAQIPRDSLFTRELLLHDLDSLKQTILQSHPSPFAFCGEEAFHKAFENGANEIDSLMTLRNFSRIAAKCIGVMDDSHSTVDYGQLAELAFSKKDDYIVPFGIYRKDNDGGMDYELLVARDWENVLPKGGRLLSINGMDIHEVYDIAMDYACVEGSATSAQHTVASALIGFINALYNSTDSINTFEVIPFGKETAETFHLSGYQKKEYKEKRKKRNKLDINKWINTSYDEEHSLAVLKVATFSPPSSRKFKKEVKKLFKTANEKGYKNSVIDLRDNGGGSSTWVEYLYAFLDKEGYNTPNNVIAKNSELALSRNPRAGTKMAKAFMWLFYRHDEDVQSFKHFRELPIGEMDTVYFKDKVIHKDKYVFTGNAYLLINGMSASASVDFTNTFHKKNRGVIVGEPCLGPHTGTWGNASRFKMPNTGLSVTISTIRYNYDNTFVYIRDAIQPHYLVPNTAEDLSKERDTQLEFVKSLIKKK